MLSQSTKMMYQEMTAMDLGLNGPLAFKGQNSFEDEVENIYFSDALSPCNDEKNLTQAFALPMTAGKTMTDFEDQLVAANPEEVTGQTLTIKKEQEYVDANFDISELMDIQPIGSLDQLTQEEVAADQDTDDVIQDMERFLSSYEEKDIAMDDSGVDMNVSADQVANDLAKELLSMEQQEVLNTLNIECPSSSNGTLTEHDLKVAEDWIDEMLGVEQDQSTDILDAAVRSENLQDSAFLEEEEDKSYNIAGIAEIKTENGNVIIVIQPSSPGPVANAAATAAQQEEVVDDDGDSDWTPETPEPVHKRKPGRKPAVRKPLTDKVSKRAYKTVNDRKQRKKLQNVEAARRYRDKKKYEESILEEEEQELAAKNKDLKTKLEEKKREVQTFKKLMVELGLLRVVKK